MFIRKQNICQFSRKTMLRASVGNQIWDKTQRERARRILRKCLTLIFFIKRCVIGMRTVVSTLAGRIGTQLTRNKQYWRGEGIAHYPWSCNCEHWCRSFFVRFSLSPPVFPHRASPCSMSERKTFLSFTCSNCQSFPGRRSEKLSRPIWLSRMLRWGTRSERKTEKASKCTTDISIYRLI